MQRINIAERYTLIKKLGSGGFGEVWMAIVNKTRAVRAVKFVAKRRETPKKTWVRQESSVLEEAKYLEYLNNIPGSEDYVIKYYGLFLGTNHPEGGRVRMAEPDTYYVIELEYFMGHTLADLGFAYNRQKMSVRELCIVVDHLVKAVRFIHDQKVAHRDLKPPNVMFDKNRLVLVDFGLACLLSTCSGMSGTPGFQAPEVRNCSGGRRCYIDWKAADVYSLGKTIEWLASRAESSTEAINALAYMMTKDYPQSRPLLSGVVVDVCKGSPKKAKFSNEVVPDASITATVLLPGETERITTTEVFEPSDGHHEGGLKPVALEFK